MRGSRLLARVLGGFCAATLALFAPAALANTYTPTKFGDGSGFTLRRAITKANGHPGTDTIVLEGGKTYKLSRAGANEEANRTGDLDVTGSLKLVSSNSALATVNAEKIDRVFDIGPGISVAFRHIRTAGGLTPSSDSGGGIRETGPGTSLSLSHSVVRGNTGDVNGGGIFDLDAALKLSRSTIQGNTSNDEGGGILTEGTSLSISKSTVAGNHAPADLGGGVYIYSNVAASIVASTISGNDGNGGGGIYNQGTLNMRNDTVASNSSVSNGGGIYNYGPLGGTAHLNNVTIARNLADSDASSSEHGGGIYSVGGTFVINNSLLALNRIGGISTDPTCYGTFTTGTGTKAGNNLLTSNDPDCSGLDRVGDFFTASPKIGALANNGGPTKTIALLKGSPAINKAGKVVSAEKRDQRGVKRDSKPDIGAYERK